MKLIEQPQFSFNDAFIYQNLSDISSRTSCNVEPQKRKLNNMLHSNSPFISANMNAVSGKRMAEAMAIHWGVACLPQDMSKERKEAILKYLHNDERYGYGLVSVVVVNNKTDNVIVAKQLAKKKELNAVFVNVEWEGIIGYYTKEMLDAYPESEKIDVSIMPPKNFLLAKEEFNKDNLSEYYQTMVDANQDFIVFIKEKEVNWEKRILGWALTKKHAVRYKDYNPAYQSDKNLSVILSYWVNQIRNDVKCLDEIEYFQNTYNVNQLLVDTAHGTQENVIYAVKTLRLNFPEAIIIAGNVCTAEGTKALLKNWANGVKVGIWPGAMCETRMQTGVGRPQLSAIIECAKAAKELNGWIIADGGIKTPRDACLALAAGASYIMMGSVLAGTLESVAEIKYDLENKPYKQNFGMASGLAVKERNQKLSPFEQARRMRFQEGISTSMIYLKPWMETVGEVIDMFTTGLQSSMSYVGARNLQEYTDKAIIGIQTSSGYTEGTPHWKKMN